MEEHQAQAEPKEEAKAAAPKAPAEQKAPAELKDQAEPKAQAGPKARVEPKAPAGPKVAEEKAVAAKAVAEAKGRPTMAPVEAAATTPKPVAARRHPVPAQPLEASSAVLSKDSVDENRPRLNRSRLDSSTTTEQYRDPAASKGERQTGISTSNAEAFRPNPESDTPGAPKSRGAMNKTSAQE